MVERLKVKHEEVPGIIVIDSEQDLELYKGVKKSKDEIEAEQEYIKATREDLEL